MIKTQGANVAPVEVETVLERSPRLLHAFVFGTPHAVLQEEVTAVVVPVPGATITTEDVRRHASESLSSYKVPTRIEIVADASVLPWLGSGKPDKLQLRERLLAGGLATKEQPE
jgi:fatty-acyl-CoA synthase